VKHWDIAAGSLLCERAGLVVETLPEAPPQASGMLVAPPGLIDALRARVA
jgi:myo-inositol-1(or 4)-monophosphatase